MVKFIEVLSFFDKAVDCAPGLSALKNVPCLIYQCAHKVNKIANPINTSWKDDIKIYALSKNSLIAGISIIPVLGNLIAFGYHLVNAIDKAFGKKGLEGEKDYLGGMARVFSWGLKKHSYEVAALYLARNPDCSEKKLTNALIFAAGQGNEEIFKLILNSRKTWSPDAIARVFKSTKSEVMAKILLERTHFTTEQAGSILLNLASTSSVLTWPSFLITLFFNTYPDLITVHADKLFEKAVNNKDKESLSLLCSKTYIEKIPPSSIDKILASLTHLNYDANRGEIKDSSYLSIIQSIIKDYPYLSEKDFDSAIKIASVIDTELLRFYLSARKNLIRLRSKSP